MGTFADGIRKGLEDAVAIERGEKEAPRVSRYEMTARKATVVPPPHYGPKAVRGIREDMGMSQPVFALALGKSPSTIKKWEQGQREPDGSARRLLWFAAQYPRAFSRNVRPKEAAAGTVERAAKEKIGRA